MSTLWMIVCWRNYTKVIVELYLELRFAHIVHGQHGHAFAPFRTQRYIMRYRTAHKYRRSQRFLVAHVANKRKSDIINSFKITLE